MGRAAPSPPPERDSRFPCGTTSPDGRWRLSRTLLSVRDPERHTHRLAGLHTPIAGAVTDDGLVLILDRTDSVEGVHRISMYGPGGRLIRTRRITGRRIDLAADLTARRFFLLIHHRPYAQVLSAHDLEDGRTLWQEDLDLERPELRVDPAQQAVVLRHALLPPRFPYVAQYDYGGRLIHRLPRDGPTALDLAETALSLGRMRTARVLIEHAQEAPLPAGIDQRVAELSSRLAEPSNTGPTLEGR